MTCRSWRNLWQLPAIWVKLEEIPQMPSEIPLLQALDKVVGMTIVVQRQVPTVQTVQKTVEVLEFPQLQILVKVVDMLVAVEFPNLHFLVNVVDMPAVCA